MREVDLLRQTLVQTLLLAPQASGSPLVQFSQHVIGFYPACQSLSPSPSQVFSQIEFRGKFWVDLSHFILRLTEVKEDVQWWEQTTLLVEGWEGFLLNLSEIFIEITGDIAFAKRKSEAQDLAVTNMSCHVVVMKILGKMEDDTELNSSFRNELTFLCHVD